MKPETDNNITAAPTSAAQAQSCSASSAQRRLGVFLMSFGFAGAAIAALCCMAPLLLAGIFAAVGFGLLLNDFVLMGLLVLFLVTAASGYRMLRGRRPR